MKAEFFWHKHSCAPYSRADDSKSSFGQLCLHGAALPVRRDLTNVRPPFRICTAVVYIPRRFCPGASLSRCFLAACALKTKKFSSISPSKTSSPTPARSCLTKLQRSPRFLGRHGIQQRIQVLVCDEQQQIGRFPHMLHMQASVRVSLPQNRFQVIRAHLTDLAV